MNTNSGFYVNKYENFNGSNILNLIEEVHINRNVLWSCKLKTRV